MKKKEVAVSDKTNNEFAFRINTIYVKEFLFTPPKDVTTPLEKYNYNVVAESRLNLKDNLVLIEVKVIVRMEDEKTTIASVTIQFIFQVEKNFEAMLVGEGKKTVLESKYHKLFTSISLSTSRGILFEKLSGTMVANAILPIFNMNSPTSYSVIEPPEQPLVAEPQ